MVIIWDSIERPDLISGIRVRGHGFQSREHRVGGGIVEGCNNAACLTWITIRTTQIGCDLNVIKSDEIVKDRSNNFDSYYTLTPTLQFILSYMSHRVHIMLMFIFLLPQFSLLCSNQRQLKRWISYTYFFYFIFLRNTIIHITHHFASIV